MAVKTIIVTIKGKSALLMHQFPLGPVEAIDMKPKEEQAEIAAYRDPDTEELYIPGVNIQRALVAGATYTKKGRATLAKLAAATLMVTPERVSLGTKDFKIDSRAVVIKATRGRIVRHRPRLDEWSCTFELEYEDTLLKEDQVRKIVDDTGQRVGLLDFRPACKGPFGRFMVTKWDT